MLIGLISDIHDRTDHLRRALELLAAESCTHLLCMGDFSRPSTLRLLGELWPGELDFVLGNNDWPQEDFFATSPRLRCHGVCAELELGGRRIFMAHEPERVRSALAFGRFDAVFFGHTHRAMMAWEGQTLIANPGDIQGRSGKPGFALYNPLEHSLRHTAL